MATKRRRHSAACKFQVALEALEGSKTTGHSTNDHHPTALLRTPMATARPLIMVPGQS